MSGRRGLFLKYFVLNPTKDGPYGQASRKALLAYAEAIDQENPVLAHELVSWARQTEAEIKARSTPDFLDAALNEGDGTYKP